MYITIFIVLGICFFLYRLYVFFMGPCYKPGAVSAFAEARPDKFDIPELDNQTTDSTWAMPSDTVLYHMETPARKEPTPTSPSSTLPVLCVSGGPGIALSKPWALCNASRWTSHFTFHTFHPRGCGRSTRPFDAFPGENLSALSKIEHTLGLSAQIADIERIRRRLHVDRISLIGHSFGGLAATLYAAEFPQNVASLVLLAPASMLCTPGTEYDFFADVRERLPTSEDQTGFDACVKRYLDFASLPQLTDEAAAARQRDFLDWYLKAEGILDTEKRRKLVEENQVGGWAMYATYCSLGRRFDLRKELKERLNDAKFRTIIVNGREDIVPMEEGKKYAALFPPNLVECAVVDGGHFLPEQNPVQVADAIFPTLSSRW